LLKSLSVASPAKATGRDEARNLIKRLHQIGLYVDLVTNANSNTEEEGRTIDKMSGFNVRELLTSQPQIESISTPRLKPGPNASFFVRI
jgi:hypothetical protein